MCSLAFRDLRLSRLGARSGTSLAAQVAALFGPSDTGWFYDNSDFSTMFQDSAGTIPVTAVGQSVGLQLDKSKGLVLGPELVTNGTFDTDTNGWTASNSTLSVEGGRLKVTSTGLSSRASQSFSTVANTWYEARVSFGGGTAAESVRFGVSADNAAYFVSTVDGSYTFKFLATTATTFITLKAGDTVGLTAFFDNISVRELPGNHRRQATSLNRPILAQDASGLYYLSYDGVNDSLATSAFTWGTDKATLVAGYTRKNTSTAIVCEFSAAIVSNAGSFFLVVNDSGGNIHSSISLGSASADARQTARWTTAESLPTTSVISATHDIAGDLSTIRKNGVAGTNGTYEKGAGNFGNYPVYFGARAGASLFFNGYEYSQFAINRLLTESELALVERYTNSRTGAY